MAVVKTVPDPLDIEVYAGDENRIEIQILVNGVPLDITGAVLTAQCRKTSTDPATAVDATFQDIDRPSGMVAMLWDGESVRAVLSGKDTWKGVWDFQVKMPGKTLPTTLTAGRFTMRMDVTRA